MDKKVLNALIREGIIKAKPSKLGDLFEVCEKYEINNDLRLSAFLAQCSYESVGFQVVQENLNYGVNSLLHYFPKYFDKEQATEYALKPERIANRVYANRMGNGPEESGDGWKYRGRGFLQLTGRNNYTAFGEAIEENVIDNPDLVAEELKAESAGWFWNKNKLNKIADRKEYKEIVKIINGGTNGLESRLALYYKTRMCFPAAFAL